MTCNRDGTFPGDRRGHPTAEPRCGSPTPSATRSPKSFRSTTRDGRLDAAEFKERLDQAMSAKTRADLAGLLTDLPGQVTAERRAGARSSPATPRALDRGRRLRGRQPLVRHGRSARALVADRADRLPHLEARSVRALLQPRVPLPPPRLRRAALVEPLPRTAVKPPVRAGPRRIAVRGGLSGLVPGFRGRGV